MEAASCPACGGSSPEGARFCPSCGSHLTPLSDPERRNAERRIITTIFCDLVGFTALAEQADPEDVDSLLRAYYALARHVIEQHGGSVEKFIGDAVVGVFGFPRLHEDDAERGVRAAVRLQERLAELPPVGELRVEARIGVNTGHTLVRLGIDPSSGEGFLIGDPVNTAARLQSIAPPRRVVVGELTQALTANVATFEPLAPVRLRGKRDVLRPWLVAGVVGRPGVDLTKSFATPLVGREVELGLLTGMFEKACASSEPQIAFVIGDAGIGKSRLIHELASRLDERPDVMAWWRQAHCPAYDEGLSMAPIGQVLREHAGIDEADDASQAEDKLRQALDDKPDKEWLAARLRPLLGLPSTSAPKEESFAAWTRFIESMARAKPTIFVVEDMHWASPLMVEFLWYLTGHLEGVPLLGIGSARPEFLAAHPDLRTTRVADEHASPVLQIDLHPLSPPEAGRLVSLLVDDEGLTEARTVVAQRSGGNPLYAEELARLLRDRSVLEGEARLGELARTEVSDSLHALIGARLDSLEPGLKELLSDAAVVGEQFSAGIVTALSGRERREVDGRLQELARRELVRPVRHVSLPGEDGYAFWHGLTRDVAYARMTRSDRATRHLSAAAYLQGQAPPTGDTAEILAHHYTTAFTLLQATGDVSSAGRLREPAAGALAAAGDRAMELDCGRAGLQYQAGLDMLPDGSPLRAQLRAKLGRALVAAGRPLDAIDALESAVKELDLRGDGKAAAVVMMDLYSALLEMGDPRAHDVARQAVAALTDESPSAELITVLEGWAAAAIQLGLMEDSLAASGRCLDAAEAIGAATPLLGLACRAWASCAVGRIVDGLEDAQQLLELMRNRQTAAAITSQYYSSVAELFALYRSVAEAESAVNEGLELAERRHDDRATWSLSVTRLEILTMTGHWDAAVAGCRELDAEVSATGANLARTEVRCLAAIIHALRGEREALTGFLEWWRSDQMRYFDRPGLDCLAAALAAAALGQLPLARRQLQILGEEAYLSTGIQSLWWPQAVRAGISVGRPDLARLVADRALVSKALPAHARWTLEALKCELCGDLATAESGFRQAAHGWSDAGCPYEAAEAESGLARCLSGSGRKDSAATLFKRASSTFAGLKAAPALRRARLSASATCASPRRSSRRG